jgi:hypothetical protein
VDKEQCRGWCKVALKRTDAGLVLPVHWGGDSEKGWFRMVKTKRKSLFLREQGLSLFLQGLQ